MEVVVSLVTSFIVALIAMIIQKNIFERIEQSIRTKYLVEIEKFRNEFNLKIISIQNENQVSQLRTSLFFDHQRNAFAGILDKISEVNESWFEKEYDEDEGLKGPVPYEKYKELKKLFIQNQLFFDNSCLMAIDLMIDIYDSSFPVIDGAGDIHHRNVRYAYRIVEFIQPKLAAIFQNRIGIIVSTKEEYQLALFGAIRLLNSYHFDDISLPPAGNLKIKNDQEPLEAIKIANSNIEELILKLTELQNYLKYEEFYFDRVMDKAEQYLKIISPNENII
jgi:hypothetical protein